jgi:hypothetical protein
MIGSRSSITSLVLECKSQLARQGSLLCTVKQNLTLKTGLIKNIVSQLTSLNLFQHPKKFIEGCNLNSKTYLVIQRLLLSNFLVASQAYACLLNNNYQATQ